MQGECEYTYLWMSFVRVVGWMRWMRLTGADRFMAASKVLGEETVSGANGSGAGGQNTGGK